MSAIFAALKVAGPFLKASWPYLLCAMVAGYLTHRWDSGSYDRLQAQFSGYKAEVAQANSAAQQAANDALQAQIHARLDAETRNGQITQQLHDLAQERDNAARDAQFARRLLAAAQAVPAAAGHPKPSTVDQPGTAGDAQPSGDRSIVDELTAATAEARSCFEHYNALLAELQPQLR